MNDNTGNPANADTSKLTNAMDIMSNLVTKGKDLTEKQWIIVMKDIVITDSSAICAQFLEHVIGQFDESFSANIKKGPDGTLFPESKTMNLLHDKLSGMPLTYIDSNDESNPGAKRRREQTVLPLPIEFSREQDSVKWLQEMMLGRTGTWGERIAGIIHDTFSDGTSSNQSIYHAAMAADMLDALRVVVRFYAKHRMELYLFEQKISGDAWIYAVDHALRKAHSVFTKPLNMPPPMPEAIAEFIGSIELDIDHADPDQLYVSNNPTLGAVHLVYNLAMVSGSDPTAILAEKILGFVPEERKKTARDNVRRYAIRRKLSEFDMTWENRRIRLGTNKPVPAGVSANEQVKTVNDEEDAHPNLAAASTASGEDEFAIGGIPMPGKTTADRRFIVARNVFPDHPNPNKRHMLLSHEDPSILSDGILISDTEFTKLYDAKASNKLKPATLPAEARRLLKNGSYHGNRIGFERWLGLNSELRDPKELHDPEL